MKVFYALFVFFLVTVLSQKQYDSGLDGGKNEAMTSINSSYGESPPLIIIPGFRGFNFQFNVAHPAPQFPQGGSAATTIEPLSSHFKIVCYFTNWAWYRKGIGKYTPENIDPNLCTHIVYGFAVLDYENLIIKMRDSRTDFDNKFYERVVAYKAKGIKVSLALGGWSDSTGDKYSRLVNNPAARARFIKHVLEFLEKYNFDGLDLNWQYPKCWQNNCKKGPNSDKAAFAALTTELREAFDPKGLLLSAAVTPSKTMIDAGYDVPAMARNLDWVAVMTYDFHGQWDKQTGHVAPMYLHTDDSDAFFNTNYSINYWISEGVPRRKIIMGMPLFGRSFQLEKAENNGLNAKTPTPGQAGEFTRVAGFLAYYEICDRVKNHGWTVVQDPEHRMGPYAYKGNQWVSYDDAAMIRLKSEYIRSMDLGGGMIWAVDTDDFRNICGEGHYPLLRVIREVLREKNTPPEITVRPVYDGTGYKVICYFTNWAGNRPGDGKYLPSDIDDTLCTHISYGFAVLDASNLTIKVSDSRADIDNELYKKVTALRAKGIKVLIAMGGWTDSTDKYSHLVNNPSARDNFITNVMQFIAKYNFDGLDLFWHYPKCWQNDCSKGPSSDKEGYTALIRELSVAFKPKGLLISAAVSPKKGIIDVAYEVPQLSKYFDWITVLAYGFHGYWDTYTGHTAQLFYVPGDKDYDANVNFAINYWINQGADPLKIIMGVSLHGRSYSLADASKNQLNSPSNIPGEAGELTQETGILAYYEICDRTKNRGWTTVRDDAGLIGPYAYSGNQWVSYDDVSDIVRKSKLIKQLNLGGGMIWALDFDDFRNRCGCGKYPLLKAMNYELRVIKIDTKLTDCK